MKSEFDSIGHSELLATTDIYFLYEAARSYSSPTSVNLTHVLRVHSTIFLTGKEIATYLRKLESGDAKIHEIDFDALRSEAAAPAAARAPVTEKQVKDDGKIGGAVQIAIGVKKEVDFATWYTNASSTYSQTYLVLIH